MFIKILRHTPKILFLTIWLLITLFPFYWMIITSFEPVGDLYTDPVNYWPKTFTFENYKNILSEDNFTRYLLNSSLISIIAGVSATIISIFSGYVLARLEFQGKSSVLLAFLVTQMLPSFISMAPLYIMLSKLNGINNYWGITLVYVAISIPFSTVMLRGFFAAIPDSLEEAAMVDGLSRLQALFKIILPVMKPGIIAAFIFNFVNCWNEIFLSSLLLHSEKFKTIPAYLNGNVTSQAILWQNIAPATVLAIVPTMIMFAFASKYIVQGLTSGAVKE